MLFSVPYLRELITNGDWSRLQSKIAKYEFTINTNKNKSNQIPHLPLTISCNCYIQEYYEACEKNNTQLSKRILTSHLAPLIRLCEFKYKQLQNISDPETFKAYKSTILKTNANISELRVLLANQIEHFFCQLFLHLQI